jgi:hypothetical protein
MIKKNRIGRKLALRSFCAPFALLRALCVAGYVGRRECREDAGFAEMLASSEACFQDYITLVYLIRSPFTSNIPMALPVT